MPWLTPDSIPEADDCRPLSIPADSAWLALVSGALTELTLPYNWEKFGTLTVAETVAKMQEIIDNYYNAACGAPLVVDAPYWDETSGDDTPTEAPAEDQIWYGQWDGETFLETLSYVFLSNFLAKLITPQGAIKFLTIPRAFRVLIRQNPHGANLLLFLDGGLFKLINGYSPFDKIAEFIIASPGTTLMLVHAGTHDPDATPDEDGNYVVDVIRGQLTADDVLPPNIRYTDTDPPVFQTTTDGTTWVDSPQTDPRYNPAGLLPHLGPYSGIECDVAARMTAQLKDTLANFIAAGDAAQFATMVLALLVFPFGWAGWFLDLLLAGFDVLIDIGQSNIEAAFTDAVYDDIRCAFSCFIDSNGQISQENLDVAYDQIEAAHPGTVANTIAELRFFYGDVAMSNAGVARDETGDCSACPDCDWIVEYDFTGGNTHGFKAFFSAGDSRGTFLGDHWAGTLGGGNFALLIFKAMPGIAVSQSSAFIDVDHGTGIGNLHRIFDMTVDANPPTLVTEQSGAVVDNGPPESWLVDGAASFTTTEGWGIDWNGDSNGTGYVKLYKLRIAGTGTPPADGVRVGSLS